MEDSKPMNWTDLQFWKSDKWDAIQQRLLNSDIAPAYEDIFKAFLVTPLQNVRAVIIGQDPYPNPDHATGLAFSIPKPFPVKRFPPTLANIFAELVSDVGCPYPKHGCLMSWAEQGVLLLNLALTTKPLTVGAHRDWGWDELVNEACQTVSLLKPHAPFILWGKDAQSVKPVLSKEAYVIESGHPSPIATRSGSSNFFGSKPFSKCNVYLMKHTKSYINWRLEY